MSSRETKKQIVVIGGGFGGIKAALELSRNDYFDIILISDKPNFRYNPTLYHAATGGLMRQSSIPMKDILGGSKINFILGEAKKLDRSTQSIELTNDKVVAYDKLVLALGVVTNYFNIKGLEKYSYGIKSPEEVRQFKAHLHSQLEQDGKPDLNYLIVGGGPTGIELAGALPAYLKRIMKFHGVKDRTINIKLIEAADRLLPRSHPSISKAVCKRLKKLGVDLIVSQAVKGEDSDSLMVGAEDIPSETVVWTAGTSNHPFFKNNDFALDEHGKVIVDDHLQSESGMYVIGDNAATKFSGLAQTAIYDGHYVAHDIEAKIHGNDGNPYSPRTPASVIPVGPGWAAFEWGKIRIAGRLGWIIRQAADWIGYHDLEPWWEASAQWMTEFGEEEDCKICQTHNK